LPTGKILSLLDQAYAAGMTVYTVWGGEPLLAERLPEWLQRARKYRMQTVVCTAGFRLEERAKEIGPYVERLLLSVEGIGEKQDRLRATPGLFARIVAGIRAFRGHSSGVICCWSNLTRENLDQVEEIARFAQDQEIGVEFFPAAVFPGFNERLILSSEERNQAFARILDLKRRGYPIRNTGYALELMRSGRPFRCNFARLSVQVSSRGEISACEPRLVPGLAPYGAIEDLDLRSLRSWPRYHQERERLLSCNRCLFPCVAHMADGLVLQSLRAALSPR